MERVSKDRYYLDMALATTQRSTCLKRHYGAVVVNHDEVIATGYNGNPRNLKNCCDTGVCVRLNSPHNSGDYSDCHSVHAEQNAMISASRERMIGSTLYLAGYDVVQQKEIEDATPCPICARMMVNAGIVRVVNKQGEVDLTCLL